VTARLAWLAASVALVSSVVVCAERATAADRGQANLNTLILHAAQVGTGYRLQQRPDGHGARGYVTLDLCGFAFPSESLRTGRLQVNYVHSGTAPQLSNEVVTYRPAGARQALREVTHAARLCPRGPVGSNVKGVPPLTYRVSEISDAKLLHQHLALRVHYSGTIKGRHREETVIAVYQIRRNVLSAVYTYESSIAERIRVGLHAAEESAKNLKRFV
jgi:hypothetical protein